MKIKDVSSYSFTYLFIVLSYLEEYYQIDYNLLKDFINDDNFMDEVNWHLSKLKNDKIINILDNKIIINKDLNPVDIMYIIKVNIKSFNNVIIIMNDFMIYENESKLVKKKTV